MRFVSAGHPGLLHLPAGSEAKVIRVPGGDYYDVLRLNDEQWLVFVGKASGHGGAAAVLGAMARMVLHSCPLASGRERPPFCPVHGWAQTLPTNILAGKQPT